jgi:hypothetical protein
MATIIKADGTTQEVSPANGTNFRLKEVQAIVGGLVQVLDLPDNRIMLINEEGKLDSPDRNEEATKLAGLPTPEERRAYKRAMEKRGYFIIDATGGDEDFIAGDVLVCEDREFR